MIRLRRHPSSVLLVDALLFLAGLAGVYAVAERARLPATLKVENGRIAVVALGRASAGSGLRPGDILYAVQGHKVFSPKDVEFVVDGLGIGETAALEIDRNGLRQTVSATLASYYRVRYLVIQLLVGTLFFLLGVYVFVKCPREEAAGVFHWGSVGVALMTLTTWGRYTIRPLGLGHVQHLLFSTANAFVPVAFVHFTLVFPLRKGPGIRRLLPPLYLVAALLSAAMAATFLRATFPLSIDWFHRHMAVYDLCRWFFSAGVLLAVANLIHSYHTAPEESERRKLRWILLGLTAGSLSYVVLWEVPILLRARPLVAEEWMLLISAIIPITFVIAIVRYHILDIDLLLHRSTVYATALAGIATVYAVLVGTVAAVVGTFTVSSSLVVSAVAAVVVALLFEPVRARVQHFVDRRFFRTRYDLRQAQRRLAEEVQRCLDFGQLAELVVQRLDELLQLQRIGFLTTDASGRQLELLAHRNCEHLAGDKVHLDVEELSSPASLPVALDGRIEPGSSFVPADPELFRRRGIVLCYKIGGGPEHQAFLVLGEKKSGGRFSIEDMDLLNLITTQVGLTLQRIAAQQKWLLEHAQAQRLEELNRLKSYFVSSVSHELKTPLASIKLFAELLQQKKRVSRKQLEEHLEIIEGETDRLTRLIDNVLDFDKIERGAKEYHFAEVNLNQTVRQVLRLLGYQLRMNRFTVHLRLSREESNIHADADAVIQALTNLLTNAMKYSPDSNVITVSTSRRDDFAVVSVKDNGIGIPETDLGRIFEPFYRRSQDAEGRRRGGVGLGLALVQHIMQAHGGRVEVDSTPGKGSTFSLLFPLREEAHETHSGD